MDARFRNFTPRRKKILIVDDDPDVLEVLGFTLREAGFEIIKAGNGLEALKKARALQPDLVLLDLVLPEQDGFTVCEKLRNEDATRKIPVIMLTGLMGELSRLAGLSCGADDYLVKPITPDLLLSRVGAAFGTPCLATCN